MSICTICRRVYSHSLGYCPYCKSLADGQQRCDGISERGVSAGSLGSHLYIAGGRDVPDQNTLRRAVTGRAEDRMGAEGGSRFSSAQPVRVPAPVSGSLADLQLLTAAANKRKLAFQSFEFLRNHLYQQFYIRRPSVRRGIRNTSCYENLLRRLQSPDFQQNQADLFRAELIGRNDSIRLNDTASVEQVKRITYVKKNDAARAVTHLMLSLQNTDVERLFIRLAEIQMYYPVASMFTILGVQDIGQGPDDVTIVLNRPLNSDSSMQLIRVLKTDPVIGRALVPCLPLPMGREAVAAGISGVDMPFLTAEHVNRLRLNRQRFSNHGWLMCSMATYVALYTRSSEGSGTPSGSDFAAVAREVCRWLGLDPLNPAHRIA